MSFFYVPHFQCRLYELINYPINAYIYNLNLHLQSTTMKICQANSVGAVQEARESELVEQVLWSVAAERGNDVEKRDENHLKAHYLFL